MAYCGYLLPHVGFITGLSARGVPAAGIVYCLSVMGVSATASNVNYVLRSERKKVAPVERITKTVMAWQSWTPEMQEAEFQMGYSR